MPRADRNASPPARPGRPGGARNPRRGALSRDLPEAGL